MWRRMVVLISVWILGCAPQPDPSVPIEPVVDRIEIHLTNPPTSAFDRVKTSFLDEGLQIASASADGGLIVSVAVRYRPGAFTSDYIYRAVIASSAGGSTVTLSATLQQLKQGEYSNPPTVPLTSVCKRYPTNECNEAWTKLERIAARLRGP